MGIASRSGVALLLALAFVATACGGGGNDDDNQTQTVLLDGINEMDGIVTNEGFASSSVRPTCGLDQSGVTNVIWRGIFSFDISSIPAGATITDARLVTRQGNPVGDPYGYFVNVLVDHLNLQLSSSLSAVMFNVPALDFNIGTLSNDANQAVDKELDVTAQVQEDVDAGRTSSSYRIRGQIEALTATGPIDLAQFNDSEDSLGTGSPARLEVTFE